MIGQGPEGVPMAVRYDRFAEDHDSLDAADVTQLENVTASPAVLVFTFSFF